MTSETKDRKVAIVVADGFEQVELTVPREALAKAGFGVEIVSPSSESTVQGYNHMEKGEAFPVDVPIAQAQPDSYAALLLPGGVHNPDALRQNAKVLDFVRHFFTAGKPVAAICHGPWTLIDAEVASGRRLTSWASIKTDLVNAGADWVNESVVVDRGLVTSRGPHDLPAFCKKMVEEFQREPGEGAQEAVMLAKLGELIRNIKVAMLTTRNSDGTLHSYPMMTQGKRFDRNLWFFTSASSHKCLEVENDCSVNVSYADPSANRYVSVSGRARLVREREKLEALWSPLMKAWFPKGIDDPDLSLLQVTIERAEYWDAPAGNAVTLFQLAKSLLTGRPYQGELTTHERIELEPSARSAPPPESGKKQGQEKPQDASPAPADGPDRDKPQSSGKADKEATKAPAPAQTKDKSPPAAAASAPAETKSTSRAQPKAGKRSRK